MTDLITGIASVLAICGATFVYMSWDSGVPIGEAVSALPLVLGIFAVTGISFAVVGVLFLMAAGLAMTPTQRRRKADMYIIDQMKKNGARKKWLK